MPPKVFCKKGVLRKHLCQSLNFNFKACNFIKKDTLAQVFSCEFCKISKNKFFTEHPQVTASVAGINQLLSFWQKCHFISGDKCHVNIYPKWNHSKGNICACECKNTRLKNQNKKEIYFARNEKFYFLFLISSDRIFRNGGLARVSTFREGLLGKRGWLFSRGCRFYIKNKLKAQIFNHKKLNT